jgi:hypothetical protein
VPLNGQESLTMFDFNLERAASYLVEQQQRSAAAAPPTSGGPAAQLRGSARSVMHLRVTPERRY